MLTLRSTSLLFLLLLPLLLTPVHHRFCARVRRKQIKIDETSWPTFMYDDYNSNDEDTGEGFTRGYYLMKVSILLL